MGEAADGFITAGSCCGKGPCPSAWRMRGASWPGDIYEHVGQWQKPHVWEGLSNMLDRLRDYHAESKPGSCFLFKSEVETSGWLSLLLRKA